MYVFVAVSAADAAAFRHAATNREIPRHGGAAAARAAVLPADIAVALAMVCQGKPRGHVDGKTQRKIHGETRGIVRDNHRGTCRVKCRRKFRGKCTPASGIAGTVVSSAAASSRRHLLIVDILQVVIRALWFPE